MNNVAEFTTKETIGEELEAKCNLAKCDLCHRMFVGSESSKDLSCNDCLANVAGYVPYDVEVNKCLTGAAWSYIYKGFA
jgi:hypothetical protein